MNVPRFDSASILTIGDAMLDRYWHGETSRVSAEAPIPVIDVAEIEDRPGGAANVALNVSTLGAKSSLIAAVGRDEAASVLRAKMESSGIDHNFVELPDWPTITKIRLVSRNQQMLRADFEESAAVSAGDLTAKVQNIDAYDSIILSDYDKGLLFEPAGVIELARNSGKPVLVDPKFKSFEAYSGATLIKPNTLELEKAVGHWESEADMLQRCRTLMQKNWL